MQAAGVDGEQVLLLLEDHNLVSSAILEVINSLLMAGEVRKISPHSLYIKNQCLSLIPVSMLLFISLLYRNNLFIAILDIAQCLCIWYLTILFRFLVSTHQKNWILSLCHWGMKRHMKDLEDLSMPTLHQVSFWDASTGQIENWIRMIWSKILWTWFSIEVIEKCIRVDDYVSVYQCGVHV